MTATRPLSVRRFGVRRLRGADVVRSVCRPCARRLGRFVAPALRQLHDPACAQLGVALGLSGDQYGGTTRGRFVEQGRQRLASRIVQLGHRVVEDDQFGFVHQRLDDAEPPQLTTAELPHRAIELQPQPAGELVRVRRTAAAHCRTDVQYVSGCQRSHRLQILDQVADPPLQVGCDWVSAEHLDRSTGRQLADDQPADRALARPVRPRQHDDLAVPHGQIREPHAVRRHSRQPHRLIQPLHRAHHSLPSIDSSLRRGM
ncbi:MAG TPA: hypothetical protein VGL05_24380 [Kribbella sp.]